MIGVTVRRCSEYIQEKQRGDVSICGEVDVWCPCCVYICDVDLASLQLSVDKVLLLSRHITCDLFSFFYLV